MKELKRNPRSYKIADKDYKNAIRRAKKDGRKVARIAEEVITAYADGAWTITFDVTPKELQVSQNISDWVAKWNDSLVQKFAIEWLNKRVKWAIMHDYAAAPIPIQLELDRFKTEQSIEDKEPTAFQWSRLKLLDLIEFTRASGACYGITNILDQFIEQDYKRHQYPSQSIPAGTGTANDVWPQAENPVIERNERITARVYGASWIVDDAEKLVVEFSKPISEDNFRQIKHAIEDIINP